jgi:hypothetical protein
MQAALQDLASTRHNTQSFVICQRVLHNCHEIIFGDLPPPAPVPYASLNLPFHSRFVRKKVRAHAEPALIGMSMILAGAPGMPRLTQIMGEVAIEQGRVQEEGQEPQRLATHDDNVVRGVATTPDADSADDDDNEVEDESPAEDNTSPHSRGASDLDPFGHIDNSGNHRRRQSVGAARTSPALPLHMRNIRKPRLSDDPLGQNDPPAPIHSASPYQSSPSISSSSKHQYHPSVANGTDLLLQKYDLQSQSHLLRSQYCRSEVRRAFQLLGHRLPDVHLRCNSCSL